MTINVAFIGAGRISDLHAIGYLNNPDARIVAICDPNLQQAQEKAAKWGLRDVQFDQDFRQTLARTDIDLVEILVPHHLHSKIATAAIEAGKIVSLQKPMCNSLVDAQKLTAIAKTAQKPVKIFENFIFYPPVAMAKSMVDAGEIGDPISIRIKSNPGKGKDSWQVPASANAWRQDKSNNGGGPLVFDDGHHKFALAWYFMGKPTEIHSFIGQCPFDDDMYFDAPSQISFRFGPHKIGNLEIVYSPDLEIDGKFYAQDDRVEITGTKGIIWINGGHGHLNGVAPLLLHKNGNLRTYDDIPTNWDESFKASTLHFVDAIKNGTPPLLTPEQGMEVLSFALAAENSALIGKSVGIKGNAE